MSRLGAELNATQGSLLGFLSDGPRTGWDLVREIEAGLGRFWNVTTSHVYRELRRLEEAGLIVAGPPEARDRRPFAITESGRTAFERWVDEPPGVEQIRFPLLVKLWFARHLDPQRLETFLAEAAADHRARLSFYRSVEGTLGDEDDRSAVVRFGVAYEQSVLDWIERTAARPAPSRNRRGTAGTG